MNQQSIPLFPLTDNVLWSAPDSVRDRPVMGAVIGNRHTLIIEAGASPAHAFEFTSSVKALRRSPIRLAVITHWHWDHVFGIDSLNLPIIAHHESRKRIAAMAQLGWSDSEIDERVASGQELAFTADHMKMELSNEQRVSLVIGVPDVLFDEHLEVDLGDMTCQIFHVGGDHSPDSSVVFIPGEQVVFLGDCFYSGFIGNDLFYTLPRLLPLLDKLLAFQAEYYLPAHHSAPLTRNEFQTECNLLRKIGELVCKSGHDREYILARLEETTGETINQGHIEYMDAFIRGLGTDIP